MEGSVNEMKSIEKGGRMHASIDFQFNVKFFFIVP